MTEFTAENGSLADAAASHLISDLDYFGVWDDDYDTFLRKRAEAVSAELRVRVIERDVDTKGQTLRSDDFEEEMAAFE